MRIISHHVLTALGFAAWAASAQTSGAPPTTPSSTQAPASAFEVASIKSPAPLSAGAVGLGAVHLGLHVEGSLVEIGRTSLASLIEMAYRLKSYELSGPAWMRADRWDIVARLPGGASADQVPEMLQTLLADRFKLRTLRESSQHEVYALVVGKAGPRLQTAQPVAESPSSDVPNTAAVGEAARSVIVGEGSDQLRMSVDAKGGGLMVTGGAGGPVKISRTPEGMNRLQAQQMTISALAGILTDLVHRQVVDKTGLSGRYQITLEFAPDAQQNNAARIVAGMTGAEVPAPDASEPAGPTIFGAIQRLGLRLESQKEPIKLLVVDHVERMPSEN